MLRCLNEHDPEIPTMEHLADSSILKCSFYSLIQFQYNKCKLHIQIFSIKVYYDMLNRLSIRLLSSRIFFFFKELIRIHTFWWHSKWKIRFVCKYVAGVLCHISEFDDAKGNRIHIIVRVKSNIHFGRASSSSFYSHMMHSWVLHFIYAFSTTESNVQFYKFNPKLYEISLSSAIF